MPLFKTLAFCATDTEAVQDGRRAQQATGLDGRPCVSLRHVIERWVMLNKVLDFHMCSALPHAPVDDVSFAEIRRDK
ncbi:hypothetical protein D3C71_2100830 [compost metagenome]